MKVLLERAPVTLNISWSGRDLRELHLAASGSKGVDDMISHVVCPTRFCFRVTRAEALTGRLRSSICLTHNLH